MMSKGLSAAPVMSMSFRPFFLAAAILAIIVMPVWLWVWTHAPLHLPRLSAPQWHASVMAFGYGGAVLAGFILTAAANWTGRPPVAGPWLLVLLVLWLCGLAAPFSGGVTGGALALAGAGFAILLAGLVWREVIAARSQRNYKVAAAVSVFALAALLFAWPQAAPGLHDMAIRLALAALAVLLALVGGRITPTFTRNWLKARGKPGPGPETWLDRAGMAVMTAAAGLWAVWPYSAWTGAILVVAGLAALARLARWNGQAVMAEPLLLTLHAGYAWTGIALLLLGLHALAPDWAPRDAGLHALGGGAVGVMTLSVMARATLGHTGRALTGGGLITVMLVLIHMSALVRVGSAWLDGQYVIALMLSGALWTAAFVFFLCLFALPLLRPRLT